MSLTPSDRHYHHIYKASSEDLRFVIDNAFGALYRSLKVDSSHPCGVFLVANVDDRAEALVAAITRYVFESNPDHPEVKAALENAAKEDET